MQKKTQFSIIYTNIHCAVVREVQSKTDEHTYRQTDRRPGRQTHVYTHTNTHTHTHTHTHLYCKVCPTIKFAKNLFVLTIWMLQISSDTRLLEPYYPLLSSLRRWCVSPLLRFGAMENWGEKAVQSCQLRFLLPWNTGIRLTLQQKSIFSRLTILTIFLDYSLWYPNCSYFGWYGIC